MTSGERWPISRDTETRLHGLISALQRWNPVINLVSRSTLPVAWKRHVLDSLQLMDYVPPEAQHWVDLGSGGGFPGLVVAIGALDRFPDLRVTLVESDQRKATFLRETARTLGVPVSVVASRIEMLASLGADVVSARALAPLSQLWSYAERHLAPSGIGLFLKGEGYASEIAEAQARFALSIETLSSSSDAKGAVLRVRRA